jgi:hypothetical protein
VSKSYGADAIKAAAAAEQTDTSRSGYHDPSQLQISPKSPAYYQVSMMFYDDIAKLDIQNVKKPGDKVYSLEINYIEKPLETHENYRVKWNYDLYGYIPKGGELPAAPSWWVDAAIIDPSATDYGTKYLWDKSLPAADDKGKWKILATRTMPGQEAYLYPQPMVIERLYYSTRQKAIDSLRKAGMLKAPPTTECFGYETANKYWLCMPQGLEKDATNWIGVNKYLYMDRGYNVRFYKDYDTGAYGTEE